ncbi:MAG: chorismate mutase [Gammaproteobacteria bacterium]
MESQSVPAELLAARDQIDQIDRQIIELLAQRFALTHRVGLLKANNALEALDAGREAEKLAEITRICATHDLNAALVTDLFTRIMEEVVRNHKRLREQQK